MNYFIRSIHMIVLIILMTLQINAQSSECAYQWIHGYDSDYYKNNQTSTTRDICCDDPVGTHIVPVAVHVIKEFTGINSPSDQIVEALISQTNNLLAPHFELRIINNPADCSLTFRPNEVYPTISLSNEIEIKNIDRVDPNLVLNIWMVGELDPFENSENVNGWAYSPIPNPTFPDELDPLRDGIVITKNGPVTPKAAVLAHEFGHYLSLHHVWGPIDENLPDAPSVGNCDPSTCDQGDEVEDTEACKGSLPNTSFVIIGSDCSCNQSHIDALANAGISNPYCNSSGTHPCKNIMGYRNGRNELTNGQRCRMIDALQVYRPNLGAYVDGCEPDCTDPCDPYYVGTPYVDPNPITDPCDDCFAGDTSDPCSACSTAENEDVIINTSQVLVLDLVHGNLIINYGSTLTINTEVVFSPESKVVVRSGGKLIVESGGLLTNCTGGDLWQGVKLESPLAFYLNSTDPGIIEMKNGGTIENAVTGIDTRNSYSPQYPSGYTYEHGGGIVNMNNGAKIDNCETGIHFARFGWGSVTGNGLYTDEQSVINNSFISNCDIGIYMDNNIGLEMSGTVFTDNYPDVESHISSFDFTGNTFHYGIEMFAEYPSFRGANIISNNFVGTYDVGSVLFMESHSNAEPVIFDNNSTFGFGMIVDGDLNFLARGNDFYDGAGIQAWESGDFQFNMVERNSFYGNEYGSSVDGVNDIEYLNNCFENTTKDDIEVGHDAKIHEAQGDPDLEVSAGNCFDKRIRTGNNSVEFDYWTDTGYEPEPNPSWNNCRYPGEGNFIRRKALTGDQDDNVCGTQVNYSGTLLK